MPAPILITVFEDNDSLRASLLNLLELSGEFVVVSQYSNAENAVEAIKNDKPDVVLMDIDMPGTTGVEAVKKIRVLDSTTQIIMLTVFDDNVHVLNAMAAGANGYLLKKYVSDKLIDSIHEVLSGGAPMSPSVARMIISSMRQQAPANAYHLTAREKETLQLLAQGNSFKMIGAELDISIDTVRTHIKRIYEKLQVRSQIEAVSKAFNEKLV